jgi:hypothetical protein
VRIGLLFAALLLAACSRPVPAPARKVDILGASLVPAQGALLGAYMDFGDREDDVTLEKIEHFEELTGKAPAIVASSSYWGEQSFPSEAVGLIARHGAIPLIFWSPWDRPYEQEKGPDKFSLQKILAGDWDAYIDAWADGAKQFGRPMFVSLCNEMNGSWFPWSGYFYGQGNAVAGDPKKFQGPETCKAAWRYIVNRVRARGAANIRWVFHLNNYSYPDEEWNEMAQYYPGPDYVDWLGISVYGKQFASDGWGDADDLLDYPYQLIGEVDPSKPVMITEFGIGEFPKAGDKARWIREIFAGMKTRCPRLKAAVFWHERWQNADGSYSNLRVNSSVPALEAFRASAADPFWLSQKDIAVPAS